VQALGHLFEQLIAGIVPQGVIDAFEMVNVEG